MIKKLFKNKKNIAILAILFGVAARFFVMSFGHNFDFDSYCIVGDLVAKGKSVYANTNRYNYGFIFFCIQGLLYKTSLLFENNILAYRILMVCVLTITDLLIAYIIFKIKNLKTAILFFINPVSIIISGYHNQFDNIAILLALATIFFYNDSEKININDFFFILFASLSLITKHIFAFFPLFILFSKKLKMNKKIIYSFIPPIIFFLSFIPFALQSKETLNGIISNVFLYNSSRGNTPLLAPLYNILHMNPKLFMPIFIGLIFAVAIICRNFMYKYQLSIYVISLVCFSSSVANQYLAIPMAGLFILDESIIKQIYMLFTTIGLSLDAAGLHLYDTFFYKIKTRIIAPIIYYLMQFRYYIAVYILFIVLVNIICVNKKTKKYENLD